LTASTSYYHHWIQDTGVDSNILTSDQFTTAVTPVAISFTGNLPPINAVGGTPYSSDESSNWTGTETPFTYAESGIAWPTWITVGVNDGIISGTPGPSDIQASTGGYSVTATDDVPNTPSPSNTFNITVADPPDPVLDPTTPPDAIVAEGNTASFTVVVDSGTAPFTYAWFETPATSVGTDSATYNRTSVVLADDGKEFYCTVTDAYSQVVQSRQALLTVTSDAPPTFADVQLLLHGGRPPGSTVIVDSSSFNRTAIYQGVPVYSDAKSVFASTSIRFPTGQQGLTYDDVPDGGPFTLDFFVADDTNANGTTHYIARNGSGNDTTSWALQINGGNVRLLYNNNYRIVSPVPVAAGTFFYGSLVYDGLEFRLYIQNGATAELAGTYSATTTFILAFQVGFQTSLGMQGNMEEVRYTRGVWYADDFPVPTAPFPDEGSNDPITFAGEISTPQNANVNVAYNLDTTVNFGGFFTPFTFTDLNTKFPWNGLTFADGVISGTPDNVDSISGIVVRGTDTDSNTDDTNSFAINVAAEPAGLGGIFSGNTPVTNVFAGAVQVKEVYAGSVLIWTNETPSQAVFDVAGGDNWTCPDGTSKVSVLCIGGGGQPHSFAGLNGGGGGGLAWVNDIDVVAGVSYNLQVGAASGDSWFISPATIQGSGGTQDGVGGGITAPGGGGGIGGAGGVTTSISGGDGYGGGGSAGGYGSTGAKGGDGGTTNFGQGQDGDDGTTGSGGGGGGGQGSDVSGPDAGAGGGTGILGQGANGVGGAAISGGFPSEPGTAGSGGSGQQYGGGGGDGAPVGSTGVVRIMWGGSRSYPSDAGDV
jgi:hypothetical protein